VTSWNLAFRLALSGRHHRSETGQGPDQEVIVSHGSPPAERRAGGAEIMARAEMVTAVPEPSVTSAGTGIGQIVAGAGAGSRPGHG